jgi:uncharacterized protein YgiM (DUF1202 family)
MKSRLLLLLTGLLATPLAAQVITNTPPPAAAAPVLVAAPVATIHPYAKPAAKKKKPAKLAKLTSLTPGPATIAGSNINIRAQATIASEVVTRLHRGEPVIVLEIVTLKATLEDEPAQWAKITYPSSAHVFVHTGFVNLTNKTVAAAKLNLRAGPGENYSVVGRLHRGDAFSEIATKGAWMEIESSTNAAAFVAAEYVTQDVPAAAPAAPAVAVIAEAPAPVAPVVAIVTNTPVEPVPAALTDTNPPVVLTDTNAPAVAVTPAPEPEPEPLPKRIVQREGNVRRTTSIQAPGYFELADLYQSRTMNYLVSPSAELDLKRYHGKHVLITGEEGLDERWPNTPVLIVQKIQPVD